MLGSSAGQERFACELRQQIAAERSSDGTAAIKHRRLRSTAAPAAATLRPGLGAVAVPAAPAPSCSTCASSPSPSAGWPGSPWCRCSSWCACRAGRSASTCPAGSRALAFHWAVLQWVRVADSMMYFAWAAARHLRLALLARRAGACCAGSTAARRCRSSSPSPSSGSRWSTSATAWPAASSRSLTGSHQHDVPGGFAWYLLGHTQHDFLEVIQIADLTGAYGVTFLVAAVNALLFEMLVRPRLVPPCLPRPMRRRRAPGKVVAAAAGRRRRRRCCSLSLGYGVWRLSQPIDRNGPQLALMQTNIDQGRRNDASAPDEERRDEARAADRRRLRRAGRPWPPGSGPT